VETFFFVFPNNEILNFSIMVNMENMFCYQCQETLKGEGCTTLGVCGKSAEVALLQDELIHQLKGISQFA